jgi:hypothetical protein
MPGRTGKRAKPPSPCSQCGQKIDDSAFMRTKKGDMHEGCWKTWWDAEQAKKPKALFLVAEEPYSCHGNCKDDHKRHPDCYGIATGDNYVELNPMPDKFGNRVCLKCHNRFFS